MLCCAAQELAWSSFALLKNVNCCSVLLLQTDTQSAVLARGAVASSSVALGDNKASLKNISQVCMHKIEAAQNDSSWLLDASPPSLLRQSLIQTSQFAAPHCLTPGLPAVPQYCCTSISALSPTEHDQHKRHIQPRQRAVFPPFFLQALSSALLKATSTSQQQQQWLPDRSALQSSGLLASGCIPEGVESALLQAVPGGLLLVLAERPR